jgi:RNA polymerase sigma factor (sigma-70 family)
MDTSSSVCTHDRLHDRLIELWEQTGDDNLRRLGEGKPVCGHEKAVCSQHDHIDWVSTCLMSCFKRTGDPDVFTCLFELNHGAFAGAIASRLRRSAVHVESSDVLQEVFLNIYRYPHRFVAEKADSFRNWGHRIVRNTLLKYLKSASRASRCMSLDDESSARVDPASRSPLATVMDVESAQIVDRAYLIYLNLYLNQFLRLSAKEQQALTLVEVRSASYKEAAQALGIRLENLKMVIFRGRRKILRGMNQILEHLEASP